MSSSGALVRFPDGEIRRGVYFGTVDVLYEHLFDTDEKAWEMWSAMRGRNPMPEKDGEAGDEQPVEVWVTYGHGHGWKATANRHFVMSGFGPGEPTPDGYDYKQPDSYTEEPWPWVPIEAQPWDRENGRWR